MKTKKELVDVEDLPWRTWDPLARQDWDFRARGETYWYDDKKYGPYDFLEDEEVYRCRMYELGRHHPDNDAIVLDRYQYCPLWAKWVKAVMPHSKSKLTEVELSELTRSTFNSLLAYRRSLEDQPIKTKLEFSFCYCWPEWPMLPFLSVPLLERKRRYNLMWPDLDLILRLKPVGIKAIIDADRERSHGRVPQLLQQVYDRGFEVEYNEDTWVIRNPAPGRVSDPQEIIPVIIDHSLSNKVLANKFIELVKARRKAKNSAPRGTTDLKAHTVKMRAELVALGARRLIKTGLTVLEATKLTERLTGKPLFANPPAWSRAIATWEDQK